VRPARSPTGSTRPAGCASAQPAAGTIYAIATETTYLRLTDGAGLSPERYARWLVDTLDAALLGTVDRRAWEDPGDDPRERAPGPDQSAS
jgi:hypothetical protein